ncbi:hypothetical protein ACWD3I_25710 [Streptomyces sp. NPDC002817]|uniref:hypothetical protein n=1 Tax=Streptomyces sp. NPDC088357 TaxID=3154655 RepID=UPI003446E13E
MCLLCRALGALAASGFVLRTAQLALFAAFLAIVIAPARAILITVEDTFGASGLGVALLAVAAATVLLAWTGTPSWRLVTAGIATIAATALVLYAVSDAGPAAAQPVPHATSSPEGRSLLLSH